MSRLCLYVITYTQRVASGVWEAHDDLRITGYSEPQEFTKYVVAPSQELAAAHFQESIKYLGLARETTFRSIKHLESNVSIITVL